MLIHRIGAPWFKGGQGGLCTIDTVIFIQAFPKWHCPVNSFFWHPRDIPNFIPVFMDSTGWHCQQTLLGMHFSVGIVTCSLLIPPLFWLPFQVDLWFLLPFFFFKSVKCWFFNFSVDFVLFFNIFLSSLNYEHPLALIPDLFRTIFIFSSSFAM